MPAPVKVPLGFAGAAMDWGDVDGRKAVHDVFHRRRESWRGGREQTNGCWPWPRKWFIPNRFLQRRTAPARYGCR